MGGSFDFDLMISEVPGHCQRSEFYGTFILGFMFRDANGIEGSWAGFSLRESLMASDLEACQHEGGVVVECLAVKLSLIHI